MSTTSIDLAATDWKKTGWPWMYQAPIVPAAKPMSARRVSQRTSRAMPSGATMAAASTAYPAAVATKMVPPSVKWM